MTTLDLKGTLILTDPCYIMKDNSFREPKEENYFKYPTKKDYPDFNGKESKQYSEDNKKYREALIFYVGIKDDWNKCNCGSNMEELGIRNYITKSTIYGDWSASLFKVENAKGEWLKDIIYDKLINHNTGSVEKDFELDEEDEKKLIEEYGISLKRVEYSNFCADAGLVIVTTLEEIDNYNPDFRKWKNEHRWCVAEYPDFEGEVIIYPNRYKDSVIIECKGNKVHLIAWQTGL